MARTAVTVGRISVVSLKCERCQKKETHYDSHSPDDKEICQKHFPLWRAVGIDNSKNTICPMCRFKLFEIDLPVDHTCLACGGKHYYETIRINPYGRKQMVRCCCRMCDVNGKMIAKYSNRKKLFLDTFKRRAKIQREQAQSYKTVTLSVTPRRK